MLNLNFKMTSKEAVNIKTMSSLIADDMDAIDRLMQTRLDSNIPFIDEVIRYLISNGGKRIRPLLVMLSAKSIADHLSDEATQRCHLLAVIIEYIHTATLLHDDVIDEATLRRGNPTTNALHGNAASVLVGDFLYSRAFQLMVHLDDMDIMRVLANTTNTIAEGEINQLMNCQNIDISIEEYTKIIQSKTATLFETSARLGSRIAGATQSESLCLGSYGRHLGTVFQLMDDALDYTGDEEKTGKKLGADLSEGKLTFPLIYAANHGNNSQTSLIHQAILNQQTTLDPLIFNQILDTIDKTNAIEATLKYAQEESSKALKMLESMPDNNWKSQLFTLANIATKRVS